MSEENKKYYNNQECDLIGIVDDMAIIDIEVPYSVYEHYGDPYTEFEKVRLMVPQNLVKNRKMTTDLAIAESNQIIQKAELKAKEIIKNAKMQSHSIVLEAKKQLEEMKKLINRHEWATDFINFVEGNYVWAVLTSYNLIKIEKLLNLNSTYEYEKTELASVIFRKRIDVDHTGASKVSVHLGQYAGYGSHDSYVIKGFCTKEEAIEYVNQLLEKEKIGISVARDLQKHGVNHPKIEKCINDYDAREKKEKRKRIKELEKKLAKEKG